MHREFQFLLDKAGKVNKAAKERSKIDAADADLLDITQLELYKQYNPELPQQPATDVVVLGQPPEDVVAEVGEEEAAEEQTEEELGDSLTAAFQRDLQESNLPLDWTADDYQVELDIGLQYDLEAAIGAGEYVTVEAEPEIPAFGDDDGGITEQDPAALFALLTQSRG